MIDFPELIILDVGHGNCAILRDTDSTTVIDCPPSPILIEALEYLGIEKINNALISHSDVDHAGGLPTLLKKIDVQNVYLNPDADKKGVNKGSLWKGVRIALELAEQEGTIVHPSLTSVLSKKIYCGQVELEILSPSSGVALGGVGGEDLDGRRLYSNSMSVVIGLVHKDYRVALLPGDMDTIGLDNLLKRQEDIKSHILIFPHHGGAPGSGDPCQFANKLCKLVDPSLIVFSYSRNLYNNPRDDIMKGVVLAVPDAHVICTQLSKKCAAVSPSSTFNHLTNLPASGFLSESCCGGSILVSVDGNQTSYRPLFRDHRGFVTNSKLVPTPLCQAFGTVNISNTRINRREIQRESDFSDNLN